MSQEQQKRNEQNEQNAPLKEKEFIHPHDYPIGIPCNEENVPITKIEMVCEDLDRVIQNVIKNVIVEIAEHAVKKALASYGDYIIEKNNLIAKQKKSIKENICLINELKSKLDFAIESLDTDYDMFEQEYSKWNEE